MLTEVTIKKLWIWGMVIAVILGALFVIFAVFLNRGTLTISAEPPFTLEIDQFRTEVCTVSPCSIVLAPGEYTLTLSKEGYRGITREVSVPLGGEQTEEVVFTFIPYIVELGMDDELGYFGVPVIQETGLPDQYFTEENFISYIKRNPENGRQTLYFREIVDGVPGDETVAASFIRDLENYLVVPVLDKEQKILVIDRTEAKSALYLVDIGEKSRDNILEFPFIAGAKWVTGTGKIIFEARDEGDMDTSIFVYDSGTGKSEKLQLKTSVDNVEPLDDDILVAVTRQPVSGVELDGSLEGQLVTLEELEASPAVTETPLGFTEAGLSANQNAYNFIRYSIASGQTRLIKQETTIQSIGQIKLSTDKNSLIFLAEGVVYELVFQK